MEVLADNTNAAWISALSILFGLPLAMWIARMLTERFLARLAASTSTTVDDLLLVVIHKINLVCVFLVGVHLAHMALVVPPAVSQVTKIVAIVALFLQVALWGNAVIAFLSANAIYRAKQTNANVSARRAAATLSRIVLWSLLVALCLENLGINLTPLLAGIGIGGVAIALALQHILADMFCYVAIIFDSPFVAGDFIVVGELMGTVEKIGLRTTRVRSLSGELLIFSNQDLVSSRLKNYKTLAERRVVLRFGVAYETPADKLSRIPDIVTEVLRDISPTRLDRIHFAEMGDFSLIYEVVYYVLDADYTVYMNTKQAFHLSLISRFRKEEITFAYPTQLLYTKSS